MIDQYKVMHYCEVKQQILHGFELFQTNMSQNCGMQWAV